ncbi:hypothetical protein LUZ60_002175 [Juncus effusus]|nr:hypothetical protein LUZ60_002175 [Juncus effusus]
MVSDQEIASCVESFLSSSANSAASFAAVLRHAESELGADLSRKASFIKDQIELLTGPRCPPLRPSAPSPPPVVQIPPQMVHQVQRQSVQMVQQQPVQVTLPHPPPPAHLLFQPIPGLQLINVGGTGSMAYQSQVTGTSGGVVQVGQVPVQAGGGGEGGGQVQQVPVAFYPPPPLAYRFGAYQAMPGQQAVMLSQQAGGSQAAGSSEGSKESPAGGAKRKRGGPGGLNKMCGVSPELQKIVGEASMSRTQIVKMLWGYIRQNNLQDPEDKRKIICNDQLKTLFDTDATDMFKMNKLLSKHIIPLDSLEMEARKRRAAELRAAKSNPSDVSEPNSNSVPVTDQSSNSVLVTDQSSNSVLVSDQSSNLVLVSDKLASFVGTENREISREDALKHVWDYINTNQLEDNTHTTILCDEKLKELFGCDSVPIAGVSDMLAQHFVAES